MADAVRGMMADPNGTTLYAVIGRKLVRVARNGTRTELGSLNTRSGWVDIAIGAQQVVIVDGPNGYVYRPQLNTFTRITSDAWMGSRRVAYVEGEFCFAAPNTGTFYISAIEDATSLDALEFALANSAPDNIVGPVADHGELWLPGGKTNEVWSFTGGGTTGASSFPFQKNRGATMQTGVAGAFTMRPLDNTLFWLGQDEQGGGMVWRSNGYTPSRVSNECVEQVLQKAIEAGADMARAIAYTYQQDGHSFYCLNVPKCETTWVYDAKVDQWHERAELVNGEYKPHRANVHAYCYGKHLVGDNTGAIYALDRKAYRNHEDILVRDRISPHYADPSMSMIAFGPFELDCRVGQGKPDGSEAFVQMRSSDDGGMSWDGWREESLGDRGRTQQKVTWHLNGAAEDRVWHVRCTDDVEFSLVGAAVRAAR